MNRKCFVGIMFAAAFAWMSILAKLQQRETSVAVFVMIAAFAATMAISTYEDKP